jgi:uncharacterized protein YdhG (YjbR/CyaY superfamily)
MASGDEGLSKEERAAVKERAAELRAEAKRQKSADKAAAELQAVFDAHAAMSQEERAVAEGLHALVLEHAPMLAPKTWYGFPSYADADGKIVVFFQPGSKFGPARRRRHVADVVRARERRRDDEPRDRRAAAEGDGAGRVAAPLGREARLLG